MKCVVFCVCGVWYVLCVVCCVCCVCVVCCVLCIVFCVLCVVCFVCCVLWSGIWLGGCTPLAELRSLKKHVEGGVPIMLAAARSHHLEQLENSFETSVDTHALPEV